MIWFVIGGAAWLAGVAFAWALVYGGTSKPTPKVPRRKTEVICTDTPEQSRYLHSINQPRRANRWD